MIDIYRPMRRGLFPTNAARASSLAAHFISTLWAFSQALYIGSDRTFMLVGLCLAG
ncbi:MULTISPECIES: hypothetical protein [Sinorhizobium]|uniref:hypothetical protein n=1 Tax=Sinorhizobium TaxID=28105 RepID=UPI0004AEA135|nr:MULTISPECIES: hypothetical protein [Sinorhizobium]